ncbi:hypothetical protein KC19_8G046600 [Ceratodon purpureus]|uniref:Uncharacterized protein n=1 Tax=Ceratodon purpureus TaxID=3225 RepID=A0A8T0H0Q0_CERPU|nr:hypothetical protein KC19_8G046600 [Ceratodon purpureus]
MHHLSIARISIGICSLPTAVAAKLKQRGLAFAVTGYKILSAGVSSGTQRRSSGAVAQGAVEIECVRVLESQAIVLFRGKGLSRQWGSSRGRLSMRSSELVCGGRHG